MTGSIRHYYRLLDKTLILTGSTSFVAPIKKLATSRQIGTLGGLEIRINTYGPCKESVLGQLCFPSMIFAESGFIPFAGVQKQGEITGLLFVKTDSLLATHEEQRKKVGRERRRKLEICSCFLQEFLAVHLQNDQLTSHSFDQHKQMADLPVCA